MQRIATLILALLLLSSGILCSGAAAHADAWQCEGRVCAAGQGGCCCIGPAATRDPACAAGRRTAGGAPLSSSLACADACGCVQVVAECHPHDPALAAKTFSVPQIALAILPTLGTLYVAPAFIDSAPAAIEARGPPCPVSAVPHATPGLRAPPAA